MSLKAKTAKDSIHRAGPEIMYGYTGRPSSKYEDRRATALLRNIRNIRICMGRKPIVSVTFDSERISIKKTAYLT